MDLSPFLFHHPLSSFLSPGVTSPNKLPTPKLLSQCLLPWVKLELMVRHLSSVDQVLYAAFYV